MFRAKSPVLMSKLSITSQLSKMIGSNFYQMLCYISFSISYNFHRDRLYGLEDRSLTEAFSLNVKHINKSVLDPRVGDFI